MVHGNRAPASVAIKHNLQLGRYRMRSMKLRQMADVDFPTHWGQFRLLGFEGTLAATQRTESALALVAGDLKSVAPVVRIHSQCTTGDVFHSLRCDCHDQLHLALRTISAEGVGILLYEHQEGRGIGLMEKLKAYELQEKGLDTVEANLRLGHAVDHRDYQLAVEVLRFLGVREARLMTNNPDKLRAVAAAGIRILERLSADVASTPHSARYMETKREKLGHLSMSAAGLVS